MRDAYYALRRMMANVEMGVDAALNLVPIMSLHTLEQEIILRMRDFGEVERFSDLKLGSLAKHPKVKRHFNVSQRVLQGGEVPPVTLDDLWKALQVCPSLPFPSFSFSFSFLSLSYHWNPYLAPVC